MKSCWLSRDVGCQELMFAMSYCYFIAVVCWGGLLLVKNCYNISLCDRRMTFQQYGIDDNCVVCSI